MRFRTTIELHGKSATGIHVPDDVVAGLGSGRRPPVRVTIGGYTYRSTVMPMGGKFLLPLSADNRAGAGVAAGDEVEVELELDTAPREVIVPLDFADALDRDPDVRQSFERSSFTQRRELVESIEGAKTAETRQRRITKAIETLRTGNAAR